MEVFEQAIAFTLRWEGGISSDPDDFGNAGGNVTNLGITQPTLDEYCYLKGLPLKSTEELTRNEAINIYRTLYWSRAGCSDMPPRVAIAVFDWAVNCGVGGAIGDLQRCLGCPIDGGYEPVTSKALKDYLAVHGEEALLEQYLTHYLQTDNPFHTPYE